MIHLSKCLNRATNCQTGLVHVENYHRRFLSPLRSLPEIKNKIKVLIFIFLFLFLNTACEAILDGSSGMGLEQNLEFKLKDIGDAGLSFSENENPILVFVMSHKVKQDINFSWTLTQSYGGGLNNDFSSLTGQITLLTDSSTVSLSLPVLNDSTFEGIETYALSISNATTDLNIRIPLSTIELILIDDDPLPGVGFLSSKSAVHEGDGMSAVFVTLDSVAEVPLKLTYTLAGDAMGAGVDFNESSTVAGELEIPSGALVGNIEFDILGNSLQDGNKIINISIDSVAAQSVVGVVGGISNHALTIIDNDGPLTITIYEEAPDTVYYDPLPPIFNVIFNRPIDTVFHDLLASDFDYSNGTATGIVGSVTNGNGPNKDLKYKLKIDSIAGDGTVIPKLPAGILRAFDLLDPSPPTNAETIGDTAIFDVDTPQNPVSWSLASPVKDSTSSDITPQISGSGIANEEGSLAYIYLTSTCDSFIGSGVVSGGAFTVINIALPGAGVDDGVKNFYGRITDVANRSSNCIDLSLNYTLITAAGGIPDVEIKAATAQTDATAVLPIAYDVVFSEIIDPATFSTADIDQTGTATVDTWALTTLDNITWSLTATAVSSSGTVIPAIAINKVQNFSGNDNTASTTTALASTDSEITYNMPVTPAVPTNFYATTLNGQIELIWDSCTDCTYDLYWDTVTGVSLVSTSVLGLTSATYTHTGLTNGSFHYYKVRATRSSVPSSALTAELNAMPYADICSSGDLKSSCSIGGVVVIPDNAKISATGDIIIASGGDLQSNPGQSISLEATGSLMVESGGLITANFASLVVGGLDVQTGSTFTGDVTSLSCGTMDVGGTMNANITDSNITNLNVPAGGSLSAKGRGFIKETGDQPGGPNSTGGGGAGHGGVGGKSSGGSTGGSVYGLTAGPITLGSGGGGVGTPAGGTGGGALKLFIQGVLTNDGIISAQGDNGSQGGGGGAGGSLWIDVGIANTGGAGVIQGSGSIDLRGGRGVPYSSWSGGGGGGGRLAIHAKDFKFRGSIDVAGGVSGGKSSTSGGRGTYDLQIINVDSFCDTGTMAGSDCQLSTDIYLGDAYVLAGSNYTILAPGTLNGNFTLDLTGDLNVNSGAQILANRFGHTNGLGQAGNWSSGGGGGGHGGEGGRATGAANHGSAYGDVTNPITSGAGGSGSGSNNYDGNPPFGGGALKILVKGNLTNDGVISADGGYGTGGGAGGAGGSLWIDVGITKTGGTGILQGSGSFSASGGRGAFYGSWAGGGGGGGRIALHSSNYKFRGPVDVSGGHGSGALSLSGHKGSFYLFVTTMDSLCDTGTMSVGDCTLSSDLYLGEAFSLSGENYTVGATGAIYGNVSINLTGDLTVSAGGKITADGIGADYGAGVAGNNNNGGGGGGHAGVGGRSNGGAVGGGSYGDQANPITHGSRGGSAGNAGPANITAGGGGAIKIVVQETFTNDGVISANGNNGNTGGGGGAGGSIWIDVGLINSGGAGILQGSGSFSTKGGRGADYSSWEGGGGAGGRIALNSLNYKYRGTVDVKGGVGAGGNSRAGGAGYFYQLVSSPDSLCDNGSVAGFDCELVTSLYLGENFTLTGSDYSIRTGAGIYGNISMDLSGDLTVDAGGVISSNGFGDAVGAGYGGGASSGGGGAGHGGAGGRSNGAANGGPAYGDDIFPNTKGSGGSSAGTLGGDGSTSNGGGTVKILVAGTLTNNGTISSNGEDGSGASGSGAGGSLWIDVGITNTGSTGILTGTGSFISIGGNSSSYSSWRGGGGGGGRLALHSVEYLFRGSFDLSGGTAAGGNGRPGETGSFYQSISDPDSLCDGGTSFATTCTINSSIILGDGLDISGAGINGLTIDNSGNISTIAKTSKANIILLGNFLINPTAVFDLNLSRLEAVNMDVYGTFKASVLASSFTNLTIYTAGSMSADGKGHWGSSSFTQGAGPGGGIYASGGSGGGGGYAALGGDASGAVTTGGAIYGASRLPIYLGSGGGAGVANSLGGHGGGLLRLVVSGTLTVDGTLSASGLTGTLGAGGGSGGSLWIEANTLTGIAGGNIFANGGDGGVSGSLYGGGGSGGRIGIFAATDSYTGTGTTTVTAGLKGGGAATDGTIGLVYNTVASPDQVIVATSQTYDGDLGGLTGADKACNALMRKQGLGASWKALLSSDTEDASARLVITKPVSNLRSDADGGPEEVATNSAAFWSGSLTVPIAYDEVGAANTNNVWTGTDGTPTAGLNSGDNCSNWTSTATNGSYGVTNSTGTLWLNTTLDSCANVQSLFCVSQ